MNLGDTELAATAAIETCFLCVRVGTSPDAAANLVKQLAPEHIFTLEECMEQLPWTVVMKLDRFLKGCPGVFEHVAPGMGARCRCMTTSTLR